MNIGDSNKFLTLLSVDGKKGEFKCVCGNMTIEYISEVIRVPSLSCGCTFKNGYNKKKHPLYNTWVGMRERCNNPNAYQYKHYGGKNIYVCDRWMESFENFVEDMDDKPSKEHSLERLDVNGPYSPENCVWKNQMEQAQNRTDTIKIEYRGKEVTIRELSEISGIKIRTIKGRLKKGMTVEEIISTPVKKSNVTEKTQNLNVEKVKEIFLDNRSQKEIAAHYGCSILTVSRIQNKEWYKEETKDLKSWQTKC